MSGGRRLLRLLHRIAEAAAPRNNFYVEGNCYSYSGFMTGGGFMLLDNIPEEPCSSSNRSKGLVLSEKEKKYKVPESTCRVIFVESAPADQAIDTVAEQSIEIKDIMVAEATVEDRTDNIKVSGGCNAPTNAAQTITGRNQDIETSEDHSDEVRPKGWRRFVCCGWKCRR